MYAWIWRRLPGGRLAKALGLLALGAATVWLLFEHVFAWLEPLLPFLNVTVH